MATAVNIGDDLKSYLASSQPSNKGNPISKLFAGAGTAKLGWSYSPLGTSDPGDEAVNGQMNGTANGTRSGYFSSWFRTEPEPVSNSWLPSLSRTQRLIGFAICIGMGMVCFVLASFYIPLLILKARKFALLFTLGSIFMMLSFSFLWGPWSHLKHLFSKERLPFTGAYVGSLTATLYCAISLQNTILTCFFGIIQVVALLWYVFSYIPGGTTGLWFVSKMVIPGRGSSLPV